MSETPPPLRRSTVGFIVFVGIVGLIAYGGSQMPASITAPNNAARQSAAPPGTEQRKLSAAETMAEAKRGMAQKAREDLDRVSLKNLKWRAGGFGTVLIASFTVENKNDFAIKDLRIECNVHANSGTQIGKPSSRLYEVVPAKKSKAFKDVSIGSISSQAARAGCSIEDMVRIFKLPDGKTFELDASRSW